MLFRCAAHTTQARKTEAKSSQAKSASAPCVDSRMRIEEKKKCTLRNYE